MAFVYPENKVEPRKGCLLLAQPLLPDSIFSRTAILICEHNSKETFGLILNKSTGFRFETDETETEIRPSSLVKVFDGGPVGPENLFIIHNQDHLAHEESEIIPGLFFGGIYDEFFESVNEGLLGENDYKTFLGYTGWAPGQLEEEIAEGTWFVKETNVEEVLQTYSKNDWKDLMRSMGQEFEPLALFPERDYYN